MVTVRLLASFLTRIDHGVWKYPGQEIAPPPPGSEFLPFLPPQGFFRSVLGHRGDGFLLLLLFTLFASGCGGGGAGGGGSNASSEIVYALSGNGTITEYAINPSNGSLYPGSQTITTGTDPLQFLFDPNGDPYAFVLNNGNNTSVFASGILTAHGTAQGSVQVFSVGSQGLSLTPVSSQLTGESPVSMAIDSKGAYLVVADHGNGTSGGDVEVFQIGNGGILGSGTPNTSPCAYPNKVLFSPNSDGKPDETVYILCSSPEYTDSSIPPSNIYYCTLAELISGPSSCGSIFTPSPSMDFFNLAIDTSGKYFVVPGIDPSNGIGFIVDFSNPPPSGSAFPSSTGSSFFVPGGQEGFVGTGSSESVILGNYDVGSSGSFSIPSNNIASCSFPSSLSVLNCTISSSSFLQGGTGPIAIDTNSAGTAVYIPMTGTPVSAGSSNPNPGEALSYSVSGATLTYLGTVTTGGWPLSVSFDTTGNYAFVPNYGSGSVSFFSVGANGALAPLNLNNGTNTLPVGSNPISVRVR